MIQLLLATIAHATAICHPYSDLQAGGHAPVHCEDNGPISMDAISCADQYGTFVQQKRTEVEALIKAQAKAQLSQQSDSYDRSKEGYAGALAKVQGLLDDGNEVLGVLETYYQNLAFPEDYDEPSVTGMSTEQYLQAEKCYSVAQKAMLASGKLVRHTLKDLRKLHASLAEKTGTSRARSAGTQTLTPAAASGTKAAGAAARPVPTGKSRNGASDITGTKKAPK